MYPSTLMHVALHQYKTLIRVGLLRPRPLWGGIGITVVKLVTCVKREGHLFSLIAIASVLSWHWSDVLALSDQLS